MQITSIEGCKCKRLVLTGLTVSPEDESGRLPISLLLKHPMSGNRCGHGHRGAGENAFHSRTGEAEAGRGVTSPCKLAAGGLKGF
jgi:hypothetical protein